jgi:hypothetical protein
MALSQGVIECDRLQRVLQSRSHLHPLVPVPQQGSQVPFFARGHPNLGKAEAEMKLLKLENYML